MPTEFQARVYALVCQIPRGKVTTYKAIADQLDCGSCQAIGQALKNNPYAPEVPCHRVVNSDLSLGGFCGKKQGPEALRKKTMLLEEGVQFSGQFVRAGCVVYPT